MRVLICGNFNNNSSDDLTRNYQFLSFAMARSKVIPEVTEIVPLGDYSESHHQGSTVGTVAYQAHAWARVRNIKIIRQAELKERFGKGKHLVRNVETFKTNKPDFVIAIWDGKDVMTKHVLRLCKNFGIPSFQMIRPK